MLKTKLTVVLLCGALFVSAASVFGAEKGRQAPKAPVPSQILAAQKVFIANGDGYLYNDLYAEMKAWGHFQLVGSPGEADLVLQISFGNNFIAPVAIKLELRDPKSDVLLWTLGHEVKDPSDKGLDDAVDKVAADLKALITSPAAK